MSLFSYTNHPVLFVASAGGVTLGVTLLLLPWKTVSFGNFSFQSSSDSQLKLTNGEGNCQETKFFQKIIRRLSLNSSHIEVTCKNQGILTKEDNIFLDKWTALFPKNLLKIDNEKFIEKQSFTINTFTEDMGNSEVIYKTVFKSDQFLNDEIIGKWKFEDWDVEGKTVDVVIPIKPETSLNIYLVHNTNKR